MLCYTQEVHYKEDVVAEVWTKDFLCGLDIPDTRGFVSSLAQDEKKDDEIPDLHGSTAEQ